MAQQPVFKISRRGVMLGTLTAAAGFLSVGGFGGIAAAAIAPGDQGADGAPAEDLRFDRKFRAAQKSMTSAAGTSYNDWPVGSPASAIGVAWYNVPGTSPTVSMQVKGGDVATVMMYVASRFDNEVEHLVDDYCGGYSYRKNVNNPSVWSNHASGTAMDLNFDQHPNGASVSQTFTSGQVAAIRGILSDCGGVIYWGGDYRGTVDAMHFEINVPPGDSRLTSLATRIRGTVSSPPAGASTLRARANNRLVAADAGGSDPLIANRTVAGPWETYDVIPRGGSLIALRSHANNRYVCADSAGAAPLIANRTAIGNWETFTKIQNGDGTVSLRSSANGRYVCAENAGSRPLIANRTVIGQWEKFDLVAV